MGKKRLTSEERRVRIIEAAQRIFSEKGFHGTTTRELAGEACVSEALLFKHFPSKEAIFAAMLKSCQKSETWSEAYRLLELQPSTSTLAVMLHFIASKIIIGNEEARISHRLLLRSLSEDGAFARIIFKHIGETWIPKILACVKAALKAGDLRASAVDLKNGGWLAQHLLLMISFVHVPDGITVKYQSSREQLAKNAVIFCLSGLGFSDAAIAQHYNPAAFALLAST